MPVVGRGGFALTCAGTVWLLSTWIFSAGVATLVTTRLACGLECPQVVLFTAMSVSFTAVAFALVSSVAMLLLYNCVLDDGAREQAAAATREGLDGGRTFVVAKLTCVVFVLLGPIAFFMKVHPRLKGTHLGRAGSAAFDAGAVCASALYCFIVVPTFAIRMWRRI